MELALVIWAVGTLPTLASYTAVIFFFLAALSFAAYLFCVVASKLEEEEEIKITAQDLGKTTSKIMKWSIFIWFVACIIPDKTTSYQMLAAYGVQKVVENPQAQALAGSGVEILNKLMDKINKELTDEQKGSK